MAVVVKSNKASVTIGSGTKDIKFGTTYTRQEVETDYDNLKDKPSIEDVVLEGNKTFEELGAVTLSNFEIEKILKSTI